jgi:hypothetical protein
MRGPTFDRPWVVGLLVGVLLVGTVTADASGAVLWGDGFGGTQLRARWTEISARWWVGESALHVHKRSVNQRTRVGFAVVDLGGAHPAGLRVSSHVRLSPGHSNVGLVAPFRDARNYLYCKVELTPRNPRGAALIAHRLRGGTPSLLRAARGIGLDPGATYRLTVERRGRTITCTVQGSGGLITELRYRMGVNDIAAFGAGPMAGVRIKVDDRGTRNDEDDGRSRFLDFRVTAI